MSQLKRKSMLGVYLVIAILLYMWAIMVYFFVKTQNVVLGVTTALITAMIMYLPAIYPRSVDVSHSVIKFKTYFTTKVIRDYKVITKFTTRELFDYVYMCPIGWRVSSHSFNGICSTAFGRATMLSTPACSDLWLVVESQGKKYVVCCEEKDRELCANA